MTTFSDENKVVLSGRLTQDTSLKYVVKTKTPFLRFTLAVNTFYKDKKETLFIPVVAYGQLALDTVSFVKQGTHIRVEGRLVNRSLKVDQEEYRFIEVVAYKIEVFTKNLKEG